MEARKKYFEYYVEFEHTIRALVRKIGDNYSSKGKSLSTLIHDINTINFTKHLSIQTTYIKSQINVRNWLAHSPKSLNVPAKYIVHMKNIQKLIKYLKDIKK